MGQKTRFPFAPWADADTGRFVLTRLPILGREDGLRKIVNLASRSRWLAMAFRVRSRFRSPFNLEHEAVPLLAYEDIR